MLNSQLLKWYRKSEQLILGLTGLLLVVLVWEVIIRLGWINPLFASSPSKIVAAAIKQWKSGGLWTALSSTLIEFLIAFGMSAFLGILLGLVIGWYRRVEYITEPFIWFLYSTPLIAFFPLFVIWLGLGFKTVVMMGLLMSIIPIIVNTFSGVKGTNPTLIQAARSFGAGNRQILLKIALPSALPMIVTGLRIGVERSLIGVIVGEMFSSNQGLGFRISYFGARLQTSELFVSITIVALFGLLLTQIFRVVEARLLKWQK